MTQSGRWVDYQNHTDLAESMSNTELESTSGASFSQPLPSNQTDGIFIEMAANWELAAKHKRAQVFALIPKEWLVPEPPLNDQQVDVTGPYVHQFLSQDEIEITETDAAGIAQKTTTGVWKAVDVAKAFCHRAALAHQLVRSVPPFLEPGLICSSSTVC